MRITATVRPHRARSVSVAAGARVDEGLPVIVLEQHIARALHDVLEHALEVRYVDLDVVVGLELEDLADLLQCAVDELHIADGGTGAVTVRRLPALDLAARIWARGVKAARTRTRSLAPGGTHR